MRERTILCFLFCFCIYSSINAQPASFFSKEGLISKATFSYLEDTLGKYTFEEVQKKPSKAFKSAQSTTLNFGMTKVVYWLKVEVSWETAIEELFFWIDYPQHGYLDFYASDSSSTWQVTKTGFLLPFSQRPINHTTFVFPLKSLGKRTHTYYARITSERAIILPLRIVTKEQFYAEKPPTDTLIGLYFGILFALVIYNIFLFVGLRDIAYLYYVLSIVSTFVLLSTSSGHFFQYILPDNPSLNMLMFPFSVATLVSFSSLFTQSFLKIKEDNKFLHHALSWVRYITIATIPALLVFDDMIVTQSHYILLFILIILLLSSGIVSWRKGNRFAIYYVFAWFGYFLGGIVSMLSEQNAVPFVFATRYGAQIGSAMEVLLLSMALSRRYNAYKKEKEDAMRKALEIEKEANETLEKKVTLRTLQLKETNEELNQINEELSTTLELVEVEKRKSDKLLLNILPADVAQELKNYGIATPKRYERVTILFTDFKGFTALVAQMNPEQVLANLNYCFTAFDKIARKHHLEKIKTIGDSYMCVGGLPVAEPNNPIYAVEAALEMMTFMREWKTKKEKQGKEAWDIRIGIHTGEVVAGVVGDYKFAYDIWGDDVNTASRMESSGEAGKINISHTTYEIVKNNFICTHRGKINAKSKGEIDMYFVESKL